MSQVSIAVSQMDGVTQSNAALVEESSTASQSLSAQARDLRGVVETFRI
ncbi:methyl-accepting chemotaxis serine transducer [Pantoea sp. S62]|nr:methyl-accepting chemotaxis serine transducer [Pantoea sp. S62]